MTERGLPPMDGSPACPFVAFDDDRDARADEPDHRHRCFAEPEPAPRALAHQEAYCLSSAFPVCPTFQAWARREAAHARPGAGPAAAARPAAGASAAASVRDSEPDGAPDSADTDDERRAADDDHAGGAADEWAAAAPTDVPIESTPRRNPPRDWAAPPPWATGSGSTSGSRPGGTAGKQGDPGAPDFLAPRTEGAGLAGSAADRLAAGDSFVTPPDASARGARTTQPSRSGRSAEDRAADLPSAGPDPELAGLVGGAAMGAAASGSSSGWSGADRAPAYPPASPSGRRPSVSSTRSSDRGKDRDRLPAHEHVQNHDGPSWERARRYEAYPTIKSAPGFGAMAGLPRIAVLAGALAIAALALFFLPALLGVGGDGEPSASPSASLAPATPEPSPTPEPEPTPQTYTIQQGDTLSSIAREFGVTLDDLLAANAETITDPDRISVGDQIIIPVPVPEEVDGGAEESAAP